IEGESVDMIADPKMVFADIKSSPNALYNLLLFSGYLTVERSIENDDTTYNCEVKIPNREVRSVFSGSLQKWIAQKFNIDVNDYNAFLNDLLKGNVDAFTQKLKDYLETSASFFATGPKNSELFYNGFIMGLVSSVSSQYFVDAERESGVGRADLLLIPKPLARYQKIELKNYAAQIKSYKNVESTFKVGIAFGGKDVEVAFRE
ncbi:MAG: hypothetical protein B7Y25_07680, partial [Alphaproteobacteria bacterium 16-39-46]